MSSYLEKLIALLIRCLLFGLIGGALFTAVSGADLGLLPYMAFLGLGAGWPLTRPLGFIALGTNGVLFTAFFFAVRLGAALIVGWIALIPYTAYLTVQTVRA